MPTDNTEIIDAKRWVLETPTPPEIVATQLQAAGISASFWPLWGASGRAGNGRLYIHANFSKLGFIKGILTQAGVKRQRWPAPHRWSRRPGAQQFRLLIRYNWAGPVPCSRINLKLSQEQVCQLQNYAERLGQTPQQAAQSLFNHALALRSKQGGPQT